MSNFDHKWHAKHQ